MQVYLLRHGVAEDGKPGTADADRALTDYGKRKLRQMLAVLAHAESKPDLIMSSPLKRALQTAEIARTVLGYKGELLSSEALVPGAEPEDIWQELRVHSGRRVSNAGRAQSTV